MPQTQLKAYQIDTVTFEDKVETAVLTGDVSDDVVKKAGDIMTGDLVVPNITVTNNGTISNQLIADTLTVNNNTNISGNLSVIGATTTGDLTASNITSNNNANISGQLTANSLNIDDNAIISNQLTIGTLVTNNNASISGNLTVTGTATTGDLTASNITSNNNANISGQLTANSLTINNNANISGTLTSGDLTASNITSNNNATIQHTLNVDTINITSVEPSDTATFFGTSDSGNSTLHIRIGNGTDDKIQFESWNGAAATSLMEINQTTVTIKGDLNVIGTTTTLDSQTLNVGDNFIILNSGVSGDPVLDAGITIERGTQTDAILKWNEADDEWVAGLSGSEAPILTILPTKTAGRFYSGTTNPNNTNRLNYDGYMYATRYHATDTLLIGDTAGYHLVIDEKTIQAKSNTDVYALELNRDGGSVRMFTNVSGCYHIFYGNGHASLGGGVFVIDKGNYIEFHSGETIIYSNGNITTTGKIETTSLELSMNTPYIDFHYNSSTDDYNVRLINNNSGILTLEGGFKINGTTKTAGGFYTGTTNPTNSNRLNYDGYFYATRVYNAVYNDIAEFMYKAEDCNAEPGYVMVQTEEGLKPSFQRADKRVVGVYSDSFGYALGASFTNRKIPVALTGRVKVYIAEPVEIGDYVVSGPNGFATKATEEDLRNPAVIIGKVLQNKNDSKPEKIEILVK